MTDANFRFMYVTIRDLLDQAAPPVLVKRLNGKVLIAADWTATLREVLTLVDEELSLLEQRFLVDRYAEVGVDLMCDEDSDVMFLSVPVPNSLWLSGTGARG